MKALAAYFSSLVVGTIEVIPEDVRGRHRRYLD